MTHYYPDLGSASDWSCHVSTTQIWVVTYLNSISAVIPQKSFWGKPVEASQNVWCFLRLQASGRKKGSFFVNLTLGTATKLSETEK